MKNNAYYKYLIANIDRIAEFQEGMTEDERKNEELMKNVLFSVLFTTINRIAVLAAREDKFPEEVSNACVALTYTDVYEITKLIVKQPEIMNYAF